jgi:hypothetical protein
MPQWAWNSFVPMINSPHDKGEWLILGLVVSITLGLSACVWSTATNFSEWLSIGALLASIGTLPFLIVRSFLLLKGRPPRSWVFTVGFYFTTVLFMRLAISLLHGAMAIEREGSVAEFLSVTAQTFFLRTTYVLESFGFAIPSVLFIVALEMAVRASVTKAQHSKTSLIILDEGPLKAGPSGKEK